MTKSDSERPSQWFVIFLLALLPAGNALNPCIDVDTWWHMAVGRYIISHHALPETDPFSQLGQDEKTPWVAYSWLYELGVYGTFQIGGCSALLVLKHALGSLSFLTMAWVLLRARRSWSAIGVLALVTVAIIPFMTERPWHFTIVFTTLTIYAVERIRSGISWRKFLWLPVLYVLWANIHIQFVLGLGVLGMAFGVAWLERWNDPIARDRDTVRGLFFLGLVCGFAVLVNPFHIKLYGVVWEYATQTRVLKLVQELGPPDFARWWNWPLVILLLWAAWRTARNGYALWDLALLATALFFSLRMQRDLWYGVLVAGLLVLRDRKREEPLPAAPFRLHHLALAAGAALLLIRGVWEVGFASTKTIATEHATSYPVEAVQFLREHPQPGPLFNHFNWGGYLIWELPQMPVGIDGRTNLYGEDRLERAMATWNGEPGWDRDPDLLNAGVILAPQPTKKLQLALTDRLKEHPERWKIIYEDATTAVFVPIRGK